MHDRHHAKSLEAERIVEIDIPFAVAVMRRLKLQARGQVLTSVFEAFGADNPTPAQSALRHMFGRGGRRYDAANDRA